MAAVQTIPIPTLPVTKHRSSFFRDGFISMSVIGKSGCGKTQMLCSILDGISNDFRTVIIATVTNTPFHDSIIAWFKRRGCISGKITNPDELIGYTEVAHRTGEVSHQKPGLIIFDDFNRGNQSVHCPYWRAVVHCFTKLRNEGWHFIIVAQQPSYLPTIVRNCTTARILFDCYTQSALETFTRDVRDRIPDVYAFKQLLQWVRSVPYSYLLIQEHPFTVSAGRLNNARLVMDAQSVRVPTFTELMHEMHVRSPEELEQKAKAAQIDAGNTAEELDE